MFSNFTAEIRGNPGLTALGTGIDLYNMQAGTISRAEYNFNTTLTAIGLVQPEGGGQYDIKTHSPGGPMFGSKLFGKYASARDAGNFAAGAVAQKSTLPNALFDYGYGGYNMANNSIGQAALILGNDLALLSQLPATGAVMMGLRAQYGENPLSKAGIEAGKNWFKTR